MSDIVVDAMEGLKVHDDDLPKYQSSEGGSMVQSNDGDSVIGSSVSKSSKNKIEIDSSMYGYAMTTINNLLAKVYIYLFIYFICTNFHYFSKLSKNSRLLSLNK